MARRRVQESWPRHDDLVGAPAQQRGIIAYREGNLTVKPLQEYFAA
jgi:hypothetical protein